ncbi:hypothetical protein ACIRPT_02555 [Streptomyces sp. NPDC101227]|uniref:hypothetical protein n=1 Tax=Streptomyces sp. NPDC101227 TaxID=3366136 RepID=UPI0037F1DB3C
MTFVDGTALTASQLNTHLRDNLMQTMPALASEASQSFMSNGASSLVPRLSGKGTVLTVESLNESQWSDLATVGPQVTLETGSSVLVFFGAGFSSLTADGAAGYVSVHISPASQDADGNTTGNTIEPDDSYALIYQGRPSDEFCGTHHVTHFGALSPGQNTFTLKYRSTAGGCSFGRRRISVMPLD